MLDLGVPGLSAQRHLLGIMAQRLVRIPARSARRPTCRPPDEEAIWDHLVTPWAKRRGPFHLPVGCLECRMTGYMGRIGLYEIMLMSPELQKRPAASRPGPSARAGDPRGHEAAAPVGARGGRRHHDLAEVVNRPCPPRWLISAGKVGNEGSRVADVA